MNMPLGGYRTYKTRREMLKEMWGGVGGLAPRAYYSLSATF
jgi:hypothetical protein